VDASTAGSSAAEMASAVSAAAQAAAGPCAAPRHSLAEKRGLRGEEHTHHYRMGWLLLTGAGALHKLQGDSESAAVMQSYLHEQCWPATRADIH